MKHSKKFARQPAVTGYASAVMDVEPVLGPIEGAAEAAREATAYATEAKLQDHVGHEAIEPIGVQLPEDILPMHAPIVSDSIGMPEVVVEHVEASENAQATPNVESQATPSVDAKSTPSVDSQATSNVDSQATSTVDSQATQSVAAQATKKTAATAAPAQGVATVVQNSAWPSGPTGSGNNGGSYSGGIGGGNGGGNGNGRNGNDGNAGTPTGQGESQGNERRRRRRALISAPVRIRPIHVTDNAPMEVTTTVDVSRGGLFFITDLTSYQRMMEIAVVFPYSGIPGEVYAEQMGHIVRVVDQGNGKFGIGVSFERAPLSAESLVDAGGRKVVTQPAKSAEADEAVAPGVPMSVAPSSKYAEVKILVVESDERARETMCSYLQSEGYSAMGVGGAAAAREILAEHAPAVLIAEIEGDGMLGYELCAYVKSEPRLRSVPVILTTHSAYPSDYAKAHSVGAIICMAKPFKQEKLGHMVRLLAPPKKVQGQEETSLRRILRPVSTTKKTAAAGSRARGKHDPEFDKLCDEAVKEKSRQDRFDCTDPEAETPAPVKETRPAEQPRGFSAFRSLFKK